MSWNSCATVSSEDFVDCSFTGKELDAETGYGYFGARYMDHELLTSFISVDRYADKYPSLSPYAYCAWNPIKLIDPDGNEAIDNDDGWKIDKQNRTITRSSLDGGNSMQIVEGDGATFRSESRAEFLEQYKGYKLIDEVQGGPQIGPAENNNSSSGSDVSAIAGSVVGFTGTESKKMSKALFDSKNGTYMGKDGSTKAIQWGKNGGLNGRYSTQRAASLKYLKLGRLCNIIGVGMAAVSINQTNSQYRNGEITQTERWIHHTVDILGCTPIGWVAPISFDLGQKYGPSTW